VKRTVLDPALRPSWWERFKNPELRRISARRDFTLIMKRIGEVRCSWIPN
jgi:hypothetical protein